MIKTKYKEKNNSIPILNKGWSHKQFVVTISTLGLYFHIKTPYRTFIFHCPLWGSIKLTI